MKKYFPLTLLLLATLLTLSGCSSYLATLQGRPPALIAKLDVLEEEVAILKEELHAAQVHIDILEDRTHEDSLHITSLERNFSEEQAAPSLQKMEKKIAMLQKKADHPYCQQQIEQLEERINQIAELKSTLHSVSQAIKNQESYTIYTIKTGDTLGKIAINHKTSVESIKNLNNLSSERIQAGEKLKIPL